MLEIVQLAVLNDNYIYLIHEPSSNKTAVVDPAISPPVLETLDQKGWNLDYILNTHHHNDHIGANLELKENTHCQIIAAKADLHRIPQVDSAVSEGEELTLGREPFRIIETPSHTMGHIMFHFYNSQLLFCGDTLFSMGCGRLFEGTADQMWHSLQKIKVLPEQTQIYCAHEYTQANGTFALTLEANNKALQQRLHQVKQLRTQNLPTIPCSLELEKATNPFLRDHSPEIQSSIGMIGAPGNKVFKVIRELKDKF